MDEEKHLELVKEKIKGVKLAQENELKSVVADESVKAMGQMLELDAARKMDEHLLSHPAEFDYVEKYHRELYETYQDAFSLYNEVGYLGENHGKLEKMLSLLDEFIEYFEDEWSMELR